ncbi:MAG: tetratricopeptide repeat protein, partial [Bacteroidia bacterium]|nr:tetratricopeptide repeat protein [Bacteroidia bacterium]
MKLVYSLVLLFCSTLSFSQSAVDWYNSGIDKFEEGNTLGAIKDFNASLALDSNAAETYWGRGSVYAELEQFDDALRDLNKSITLNPQIADAYYN